MSEAGTSKKGENFMDGKMGVNQAGEPRLYLCIFFLCCRHQKRMGTCSTKPPKSWVRTPGPILETAGWHNPGPQPQIFSINYIQIYSIYKLVGGLEISLEVGGFMGIPRPDSTQGGGAHTTGSRCECWKGVHTEPLKHRRSSGLVDIPPCDVEGQVAAWKRNIFNQKRKIMLLDINIWYKLLYF